MKPKYTTQQIGTILYAMRHYGGNFVNSLVRLYSAADPANRKKILSTWPELFDKYHDMATANSLTEQPREEQT